MCGLWSRVLRKSSCKGAFHIHVDGESGSGAERDCGSNRAADGFCLLKLARVEWGREMAWGWHADFSL